MNLIHTIATNTHVHTIFDYCMPSIKKYAEKTKSAFLLKTETMNKNPMLDKMYIKDMLKEYDRILWIDADILIDECTPDIFERYADTNKIYMHNECEREGINFNKYIEKITDVKWAKVDGKYVQYNVGVMLVSKGHEKLFEFNDCEYAGLPRLKEQAMINYNVHKHNLSVHSIQPYWNAMMYFKEPGYFQHFANVKNRNEVIKNYIKE